MSGVLSQAGVIGKKRPTRPRHATSQLLQSVCPWTQTRPPLVQKRPPIFSDLPTIQRDVSKSKGVIVNELLCVLD